MPYCLVVEEDDINRQMVGLVASSCGLNVMEADSGLSALLVCQERMPEVVVVDWVLPEINGVDFLTLLRHMHNGDNAHVIMCAMQPYWQFKEQSDEPFSTCFASSLRDSIVRAVLM